jgi:hypothetical protein
MTTQHPITPPPELVRHWSRFQGDTDPEALWFRIANEAAQWGADQELEACCEWFQEFYKTEYWGKRDLKHFRAARRPKPPSLKERALHELAAVYNRDEIDDSAYDTIRLALEALPE